MECVCGPGYICANHDVVYEDQTIDIRDSITDEMPTEVEKEIKEGIKARS